MPTALADAPDVSALAEALRGPLLRISRKLRQESQKVGLSVQDTVILGYLRKKPGAGVSELADFEQTSRPTMSSTSSIRARGMPLVRAKPHRWS